MISLASVVATASADNPMLLVPALLEEDRMSVFTDELGSGVESFDKLVVTNVDRLGIGVDRAT